MPRRAENDQEKIELNEAKTNPVELKSLLEEQIGKILILRNTILLRNYACNSISARTS